MTDDVNIGSEEDYNLEFTTEGLEALVEQIGIELTNDCMSLLKKQVTKKRI